MMKYFLLTCICMICGWSGLHAHVLEGTLTNESGDPIPYAKVFVENTTQGVLTDAAGHYRLVLATGDYRVVFHHIQYERKVVSVQITGHLKLDVVLVAKDYEIDVVTIEGGKKDPAYALMEQLIDHKDEYLKQFETFRCQTYIKVLLEQDTLRPKKNVNSSTTENGDVSVGITFTSKKKKAEMMLADSLRQDSILKTKPPGKTIISLIETRSETNFKYPGTYKSIVQGYRGYSNEGGGVNLAGESYSDYQAEVNNPYLFYLDVSDADFNFYENLLTIPKLGDRPFVSPLNSILWKITYKYRLDSTYQEGNQIRYRIHVTPRNPEGPYFEGDLIVVDDLWALADVDMEILPSTLGYFKTFHLHHRYEQAPDRRWVVAEETFRYSIKDGRTTYLGESTALHTKYELDVEFPRRFFKNELRHTEREAFERDSSYWDEVRPVALESKETNFAIERDSVKAFLRSDIYLREQDSIYNHLSWLDIFFNGIAFRDRVHSLGYYFSPLTEQIRPFGVGGYRHSLSASVTKYWVNRKTFRVGGDMNYGFLNNDLRGSMNFDLLYDPRHFGRAALRLGNVYSMINSNATFTSILGRGNYLNKTFIGVSHRYEILNGLSLGIHVDYADRKPIDKLQLEAWSQELFGSGNIPRSFEPYKEFTLDFNLVYTPGQKYQMEPNRKLILGSKWPTFSFWYKKAIPGVFGSDLNYDNIRLNIEHQFQVGTLGMSRWSVNTGRFLQSNNVRFTDYRFFRGSDPFIFINPLQVFQLLGPTISTKNTYFQGNYLHDFGGSLIDKIPLLKRTPMESIAGAGVLLVQDNNIVHTEVFAGLQYPFRIKTQRMKVGVFYVTSYSNITSSLTGQVKVGFNFYNTIRSRWEY